MENVFQENVFSKSEPKYWVIIMAECVNLPIAIVKCDFLFSFFFYTKLYVQTILLHIYQ